MCSSNTIISAHQHQVPFLNFPLSTPYFSWTTQHVIVYMTTDRWTWSQQMIQFSRRWLLNGLILKKLSSKVRICIFDNYSSLRYWKWTKFNKRRSNFNQEEILLDISNTGWMRKGRNSSPHISQETSGQDFRKTEEYWKTPSTAAGNGTIVIFTLKITIEPG